MTNYTAAHDYFTPLGFNVCIADGWPRGLYAVSEEAAKWDGTDKRFALYSDQHDVYSYCTVRITGRSVRWDGNYRVTVRVDFDGEDSQNCLGILLRPDGKDFDFAEIQALLKK